MSAREIEGDEGGERFKRCGCGERAFFSVSCAAYLCDGCGAHVGLARCWCGWASDGGDGRRQLIEMGEVIGDENE